MPPICRFLQPQYLITSYQGLVFVIYEVAKATIIFSISVVNISLIHVGEMIVSLEFNFLTTVKIIQQY